MGKVANQDALVYRKKVSLPFLEKNDEENG